MAFSPESKLLVSVSYDRTIRLWVASSGAALQTLECHSSLINAVAFSPNGKLLASGSSHKTVKPWDAGLGAMLQTLEVDAAVHTLSFSSDGTYVQANRRPLYTTFIFDGRAVSRRNLPRSVFIKEQWAGLYMENLLWLPSDQRSSCIAIHESIVGFGYLSGRVLVMEFAF